MPRKNQTLSKCRSSPSVLCRFRAASHGSTVTVTVAHMTLQSLGILVAG